MGGLGHAGLAEGDDLVEEMMLDKKIGTTLLVGKLVMGSRDDRRGVKEP